MQIQPKSMPNMSSKNDHFLKSPSRIEKRQTHHLHHRCSADLSFAPRPDCLRCRRFDLPEEHRAPRAVGNRNPVVKCKLWRQHLVKTSSNTHLGGHDLDGQICGVPNGSRSQRLCGFLASAPPVRFSTIFASRRKALYNSPNKSDEDTAKANKTSDLDINNGILSPSPAAPVSPESQDPTTTESEV